MNQSTCRPAAPRASLFRRHCDAIGRAAELAGEELQQQPGTSGRSRRRSDLTLLLPQQDLTSLVVPLPLSLRSVLTPSNSVGSVPPALLRRPYALKVLYRNHDDALRQQITCEITILRTVEHPAVVRCHGMYEQANEPQILLEYMDGGFLKGRRISSKAFLADVTHQVLCGIAYLHRRHIVHNDIKPSNLLIDSEHRVKISDFGIGHILNQTMDPCNSSVGTIAYMSPKRINTDLNDGAYDGYAGDIWSFGLSILEFNMGITVISKFLSPLFV